jgi:hypothetical protein
MSQKNSFHRPQLGVDSSSSGKRTLEIISISRRLVFGFSRRSRIATRLSMLPIGKSPGLSAAIACFSTLPDTLF